MRRAVAQTQAETLWVTLDILGVFRHVAAKAKSRSSFAPISARKEP
jgi:hypothetical protein